MASNKKIGEVIMAIKTVYPYYTRNNTDKENATLLNTWRLLLNDYPDEAVDKAIIQCLKTCKMPPTPADVIEQLNGMFETSDEQLWNEYIQALNSVENQTYYFQFTGIEENGKSQGENAREKVNQIWQSLPEKIKDYIGGKSELIRMANAYNEEELKFEKTRFLKSMPKIKKMKPSYNIEAAERAMLE